MDHMLNVIQVKHAAKCELTNILYWYRICFIHDYDRICELSFNNVLQ